MKTIGWIAVFIGVVNLLCGKFLPGLSFSIVGGLMLIFCASKDSGNSSSNTKNNNTHADTVQNKFLSIALDIKIIEKVIGTDFKTWEQRDIIETVESFKRWSLNQGCQLSEVKIKFLKTFKEVFGDDDIEDILFHLKAKENEEAIRFNIKGRNTCTHYMIRWLTAAKTISEAQQKAKEKSKQQGNASTMKVRNRKIARELVISQNAPLQFINNPTTDKLFFQCGEIRGYVSPSVRAKINEVTLEDLQYAECAPPDSENWFPCLMFRSDSYLANGIRTLGIESVNSKFTETSRMETADEDLPF